MARFLCVMIALAAMVTFGCSTTPRAPAAHVLMLSHKGHAVDPTGNDDCRLRSGAGGDRDWRPCNGQFRPGRRIELGDRYSSYLNALFESMNEKYAQQDLVQAARDPEAMKKPQQRRIMLFIHGGLSNTSRGLARVQKLTDKILADGSYPIFINWQSSFSTALSHHWFTLRQGEYRPGEWFLAPFYFSGDIGRGIVRSPVMLRNAIHRYLSDHGEKEAWLTYQSMRDTYERGNPDSISIAAGPEASKSNSIELPFNPLTLLTFMPVSVATDSVNNNLLSSSSVWKVSWAFPVRFYISALYEGFGTPAREVIKRNAELTVFRSAAGPPQTGDAVTGEGDGDLSVFFRRLRTEINRTRCLEGLAVTAQKERCAQWDITLIGHSAGTIVLGNVLRAFRTDFDLQFNQIVFMAAAVSTRDYEGEVLPYLESHDETRFYHIVLNPTAEREESRFAGIAPHGTLLVWIDDYFTNPLTTRDRTVGQFVNLMRVIDATPDSVRHRMHVRVLAYGQDYTDTDPQTHGSFSGPEYCFWRPAFWFPPEGEPETFDACACKLRPHVPSLINVPGPTGN